MTILFLSSTGRSSTRPSTTASATRSIPAFMNPPARKDGSRWKGRSTIFPPPISRSPMPREEISGIPLQQYARAFFETMDFDAITVAPYMGEDSVRPFLEYNDKWTIVLGLTSKSRSKGFRIAAFRGRLFIRKSAEAASQWGTPDNLMFVIGATQPEWFENIRRLTPRSLLPGARGRLAGRQPGDHFPKKR